MKYASKDIVFTELPNEVTLAYSITGCPGSCDNCHSPWLRDDQGIQVYENIEKDLKKNKNITAVLFLGGEWHAEKLIQCAALVKDLRPELKIGLYTGKYISELDDLLRCVLFDIFDYVKEGPYIESLGGLDKTTTNQKLYKVINQNIHKINLKGEIEWK